MMPWAKLCTFIPCCAELKRLKSWFPYYSVHAEDDGLHIRGNENFIFKFCPFCGEKLERQTKKECP